jgi:RNase P protein component
MARLKQPRSTRRIRRRYREITQAMHPPQLPIHKLMKSLQLDM